MDIVNYLRYQAVFAAIVVVGLGALLCAGAAQAAGLLIADGGLGGVLKVKEQHVNVTINNGVAVTEITQVFRNTEDRQLEALYTFPVPKGASLSNFSMWINGKEMVGEVVEKKRAREIYDSYKQRKRDPGLLEQVDYKTFEMRIFPIAPRAEQRLQITYYQELDFDHDWATYVYPLATVTRKGLDEQVEGAFGINFNIHSQVPIAELKSTSHANDFVFKKHDDTFEEASLEVAAGSLAKDVVLACRFQRPNTGADLICSRAVADGAASGLNAELKPEDGYFQFTITAGKELEETQPGMDYLFLLDVSGSMAKDLKLDTSEAAAAAFINTLGKDDRFEVVTFNNNPNVLFSALKNADAAAIAQANDYIKAQKAAGGTLLNPALQLAFKYAGQNADRTLNLVILSDGITEQDSREALLSLVAGAPKNIRMFCVGVGNEVDRPLLQQVANDAGGLAAFLSNGDDFQRQAEAFRRKLVRPAIDNVSLEFSGGAQVYDVVPQKLPNLYHGQPLRVYGRYRGAGAVNAVVRGNLGGHAFEQPLQFDFPEKDAANPEIERMWAWHKIQELEDSADKAGSNLTVAPEIVRLGEGYSIATEYTSFLVLENNEEYQRWKIERRNVLRTGRDRSAQAAVREKLEQLRTASLQNLGPDVPARQQLAQAQPTSTTQAQPGAASPMQNLQQPQAPRSAPVASQPQSQPQPARRGFDFPSLPRGGGAIDPLSGAIVFGLVGLAAAQRRKRA